MDGSYVVRLEPTEAGQIKLSCIDEQFGTVDASVECSLADLVDTVAEAGTAVLLACMKNGWRDRDTRSLTTGLSALKAGKP